MEVSRDLKGFIRPSFISLHIGRISTARTFQIHDVKNVHDRAGNHCSFFATFLSVAKWALHALVLSGMPAQRGRLA